MTPQERRQIILSELRKAGRIDVNELSEELRCSKVTIRSDVRALESEGLLTRTHGGAILPDEEKTTKYTYASIYRNSQSKREIAAAAFRLINDRDVIFLDDSSTCFYLALELKTHPEKHCAVITNSLLVGSEIAECAHLDVYIAGGQVSGNPPASMGERAEARIGEVHMDKGFIGVYSINLGVGLTSVASPQMMIKRAVLKAADQVYVLADSSKFGGGYISVVCPVSEVTGIITDRGIDPEQVRTAQKMNVRLMVADQLRGEKD